MLDFCPICEPIRTNQYSIGDIEKDLQSDGEESSPGTTVYFRPFKDRLPDNLEIDCTTCGEYIIEYSALKDWHGEFDFNLNFGGTEIIEKNQEAFRRYIKEHKTIKEFSPSTIEGLKKNGFVRRGELA